MLFYFDSQSVENGLLAVPRRVNCLTVGVISVLSER